MIRRSMRERGKLKISVNADAIPQAAVNRLLAVADIARRQLRLGGPDGEAILFQRDGTLCAGQVVGVLAAPGVSLEILPKIDGSDERATRLNLVRMLARTIGLKIADGEFAQLGLQQFDLLEVLIGLFCNRLFAAVQRGLPRQYIARGEDLKSLRGRLDIKRQLTVLATTPQKVACQYEDLSVDNPLTQILKVAVKRLRGISRGQRNQRRLIELEHAFADVSTCSISPWHYERIVLDRTNTAWHDLLRLAQLLLGGQFQSTNMGDERGFSLLFEMNKLFEKFVGYSIRRATRDGRLRVTLQSPLNYLLSDVGDNSPRFRTIPDIVVHKEKRPVLIIDTKWKLLRSKNEDSTQGVAQGDIYQMMAYGQVYNVKHLMLLYPHHRELDGVGVQSSHVVTGMLGIDLTIATVDLANLDTVPRQLADLCDAQNIDEPDEVA